MSQNVLINFKNLLNPTHFFFDKLKHFSKRKESYFWFGKTGRKHEDIAVLKKRLGKLNLNNKL